jgi:hypothetical protein
VQETLKGQGLDYASIGWNRADVALPLVGGAATLRRVRLGEILAVFISHRTVESLFKDRLGLVDLKLGLEVVDVVREAATVGAAALVGKVKAAITDLLTHTTPIALATAVLLNLLRVDIGVAVLSKETGKVFNGEGGALGNALVVTVVGLVRASHCGWRTSRVSDMITFIQTHPYRTGGCHRDGMDVCKETKQTYG